MNPKQAWQYAAQWGSYIRSGDPGACMYGFNSDGRPQHEAHRVACIAYINGHCLPAVASNPRWYDSNERRRLHQLRRHIATAPLSGTA